jgi:hypothetical protein
MSFLKSELQGWELAKCCVQWWTFGISGVDPFGSLFRERESQSLISYTEI